MISDKDLKKTKEIADLKKEYEKTQRLLNEGKTEELQKHLQELQNKYLVETMIYNTANPNPPRSLEENASNCLRFLNSLIISKSLED
ncbi:MAG: hypothetical protein IKH75_09370 [Ruminococcus sp.]|nr:hypothetical protein [Ruminococcus sp.]